MLSLGRSVTAIVRVDCRTPLLYIGCMSAKYQTTVRLDREDVEALEKARKEGHSASELIRAGLRVVGARYYKNRRPPSTGLFTASSAKLGDESELFLDLEP